MKPITTPAMSAEIRALNQNAWAVESTVLIAPMLYTACCERNRFVSCGTAAAEGASHVHGRRTSRSASFMPGRRPGGWNGPDVSTAVHQWTAVARCLLVVAAIEPGDHQQHHCADADA
jgi:hypothetical protein